VLDLEFARDSAAARENFSKLLAATDACLGLRVAPASVAAAAGLMAMAGDRALTLILSGPVHAQAKAYHQLSPNAHTRVLAEIIEAEAAH
ncbi:hypothetical protein ACKI1O_49815, partial [Streptomyces scabiei]